MPYVDPTGVNGGWSDMPQPGLGLTFLVEQVPAFSEPVPDVVSRFQGREAMRQTPFEDATLFDRVEELINGPDIPDMYRSAWADLHEFRSDSEMLAVLSAMVPLTRDQVVGLFILAKSIKA